MGWMILLPNIWSSLVFFEDNRTVPSKRNGSLMVTSSCHQLLLASAELKYLSHALAWSAPYEIALVFNTFLLSSAGGSARSSAYDIREGWRYWTPSDLNLTFRTPGQSVASFVRNWLRNGLGEVTASFHVFKLKALILRFTHFKYQALFHIQLQTYERRWVCDVLVNMCECGWEIKQAGATKIYYRA